MHLYHIVQTPGENHSASLVLESAHRPPRLLSLAKIPNVLEELLPPLFAEGRGHRVLLQSVEEDSRSDVDTILAADLDWDQPLSRGSSWQCKCSAPTLTSVLQTKRRLVAAVDTAISALLDIKSITKLAICSRLGSRELALLFYEAETELDELVLDLVRAEFLAGDIEVFLLHVEDLSLALVLPRSS